MKKWKMRSFFCFLACVILCMTVCPTSVLAEEKKQEEKRQNEKDEDVTEKLYNLCEEDYDGISITAGTKKKSYLPFEKIKLVLNIKNTGYPEIQNVKSKLEAPAGYKISGDDTAQRESLGLSETFTITYDTYNAKGILMFLGVCAGLLVLLVFFFCCLFLFEIEKEEDSLPHRF